jgi:hypothetical protein
MNKLVFSLVASVVLVVVAPASGQVFIGADSGGAGVNLVRLGWAWAPDFRTMATIIAGAMTPWRRAVADLTG